MKHGDIGVVGIGVMGANLALNFEDHGFRVSLFDRDRAKVERCAAQSNHDALFGATTTEEFVRSLDTPRRILVMVPAGKAVDSVIESLLPFLEEGDILVDGGNSRFQETRRRERELAHRAIRFVGMGISGGEEGARHGPSLMPGGDRAAWERLRPMLEKIAAKTEAGPCVTHVGADGAGHFVKMVHNGIEYGDMQIIAETYDVLRRGLCMRSGEIASVFESWNGGDLESFLVEISAVVLRQRDEITGRPLVEAILDKAGQKGTGRWTAEAALELAVPVPTLAAAVDARVLSSMKDERLRAADALGPPDIEPFEGDRSEWIDAVGDAFYASRICSYAQGMSLIAAAARRYEWRVDLAEVARIWKGGCIIRARLLDTIREAYLSAEEPPNLLMNMTIGKTVRRRRERWGRVVAGAIRRGIPLPAVGASLMYFDSYRSPRLPQNLTQAQRDAFGAHTYVLLDDPEGKPVHTDWLAGRED